MFPPVIAMSSEQVRLALSQGGFYGFAGVVCECGRKVNVSVSNERGRWKCRCHRTNMTPDMLFDPHESPDFGVSKAVIDRELVGFRMGGL